MRRRPLKKDQLQDLVAYDFYVRAVSIIYNAQVPSAANSVNLSEAVDLLNKAVARDPNFFLAYCQLAFAHDLVYQQEIDHTPARLALAKSAIDSAFRLRPDSGKRTWRWRGIFIGVIRIMTARAPNLLLLNRVYPITREFTS